ncbi:MAG: DUF4239 domain-containing protein [Planctomycetia bacterium]
MNLVMLTMLLLPVTIFTAMMIAAGSGHRLAVRRLSRPNPDAAVGAGAIDAAALGLLGLLIAFWFSLAATHLDLRRSLIVEEANAIGTAWLRLDLLPADTRSSAQDQFRSYVDARLAQTSGPETNDQRAGLTTQLDDLRSGIWTTTVAAAPRCDSPQAAMLLIAALNEMFDAATRHDASFNAHTPTAIVVLVAVVAVVASILVGYDLGTHKRFEWLHMTLFAALVSSTIWVIYDLEMPRYGLIRVDDYDQTMREVREDFDRVPSPARSH